MYVCMCLCMCYYVLCMYVCVYVYYVLYVCMYVCTYISVSVAIHIFCLQLSQVFSVTYLSLLTAPLHCFFQRHIMWQSGRLAVV